MNLYLFYSGEVVDHPRT